MASKQPQTQDQLLDESDEPDCPLCIETLDLSDRGFRPCPCGYQICQFCYNNIKTTMNGLCPACRRPYEEKNIRFDAPSAEETARYKENKSQQEKKRAAAKRQEAASRQADNLSRKHLAGIRVRRQNLVYVTGLRLNTSDPLLSEKLRSDQYFGQYGDIDKIVVNKPKDSRAMQPVGVYITFFDKEAAALCIDTLDGTTNAGVPIRADYGTTKYCSAFLRHETCSNKNCTFLHEVGEDKESFTREGLSSFNASGTQSSTNQASAPLPQPSHHAQSQTFQPPAVTQQTDRPDSRNDHASVAENLDRPALPSHASWAQKTNSSRRPSQAQSFTSGSPLVNVAAPQPRVVESARPESEMSIPESSQMHDDSPLKASPPPIENLADSVQRGDLDVQEMKQILADPEMEFILDESTLSEYELNLMKNLPLLFDRDGGARRSRAKRREEELANLQATQDMASPVLPAMIAENAAGAGSSQLGGEPEDHRIPEAGRRQAVAIQPPRLSPSFKLVRPSSSISQTHGLSERSNQSQQQYLANDSQSPSPGLAAASSTSTSYGPYSQQTQYASTGHVRQSSRLPFANDLGQQQKPINKFLSPSVQPQSSSYNSLPQHLTSSQYFTSGIPGPPPGLKTSGTPPVSGGGMFGQGHGFATSGPGYTANSSGRTPNDEMMQELFRNRGGSAGSGQTSDAGRRGAVDLADPSILRSRMPHASGAGQGHHGTQGQGQGGSGSTYGSGGFGKW